MSLGKGLFCFSPKRSGTPRRGKSAGNSVACGGAEWDAGGTAWKARGKGLVLFLSIYSGTACRPLQSGNWLLPMHPVRAGYPPGPVAGAGKAEMPGRAFCSMRNAAQLAQLQWRCSEVAADCNRCVVRDFAVLKSFLRFPPICSAIGGFPCVVLRRAGG